MSFRSPKVSESLTARELTIPRRIRSWISRSNSGAVGSCAPLTSLRKRMGAGCSADIAGCLATVPPRDQETEEEMQAAEAECHQCVPPRPRKQQCNRTQGHEAHPHDRNDPH